MFGHYGSLFHSVAKNWSDWCTSSCELVTSPLYEGLKSDVREKDDWRYYHVYMQSCLRG